MFKREIYYTLLSRLKEPRRFIQVITGPRQVGKTTLVEQVIEELHIPSLYASADEPTLKDRFWIDRQWELARLEATSKNAHEGILILDEVQKIAGWSETVKRLWDEDKKHKFPLKIVLLGSAPLLMQQGLTESLAGRFEQIRATHWTFLEMHQAFGWTLDQFLYFGGYPGSASLINDESRWRSYISDSLIETTLSRDILLLNRIYKPALLRRLFELGCHYSGQILSYQKMIGQLHDAGNTTTLAHYLDLLGGAGMVTKIPKYAGQLVRQRESSPKLQVLNNALLTNQTTTSFQAAKKDPVFWGRLVESSVGAYLLNSTLGSHTNVFYWREGNKEVDFILQSDKKLIAIEVKSSKPKETQPGLESFAQQFKVMRSLVIGSQGISVETFLKTPATQWFE